MNRPNPQQATVTSNPAPTLPHALNGAHAQALGALLTDYIAQQRRQVEVLAVHRAALASADAKLIGECGLRHQAAATELMQLEARRIGLLRMIVQGAATVRQISEMSRPGGEFSRVTFSMLVQRCPASTQGELMSLARTLRELIQKTAAEQAVIRSATGTMLAHTQGLMDQVARTLSPGGAYRRPGAVTVGASNAFAHAVDLAC